MGVYLVLYFISLGCALLFYYISKKKEKMYGFSVFFMVLMIFFLVFALATDDPIDELVTTIPAFWQFVLTGLGGAFTIWKVYLNPLKTKVYGMDREIGEVKTSVGRMESEMKSAFQRLEKEIDNLIKK
ncbi:hypothetical protein HYU19_00645 [Candidatus Woesearchaeota archaeon]|nr:hypothetical protein [Candidatus Woesearchaeota archaeon]